MEHKSFQTYSDVVQISAAASPNHKALEGTYMRIEYTSLSAAREKLGDEFILRAANYLFDLDERRSVRNRLIAEAKRSK